MKKKQLPKNWQMLRFGDVARHISARVEPGDTDLEIYVGLEHLDPNSLKIKRHGVPSDVEGQKLLAKKGQIIFCKRRAYQRKVAVADWDCICSTDAMILDANPVNIVPDFLPFFMQSDVFVNRVIAHSEGSLSPRIKWKVLAEQEFPFPGKEEQRKIVELCRLFTKNNDKAEDVIESRLLLKKIIEREFSNITTFTTIEDVIDFITSGSRGWSKYCGEDGELFLRITNMQRGRVDLDLSDTKYVILPDNTEEGVRTKVQEGDVLVSITADLGLVSIVDKHLPTAYVNQHIALLRPNSEKIDPYYLAFVLSSEYGQKLLLSLNDGGAKAGISLKNLKKLKIPLPSLEEQLRLSNILLSLKDAGLAFENYLEGVKGLKKNFLGIKVG
ncbi:restriction endonuclease subunit S [Pantoea agglomerans]|uniref:restriction endonuclease subunit S n=1 Tax=Enterobacter agglomerans TaxID=549 RepID=UPI002B1D1FF9|nr:restriction endonuclease subunit S [Pantoea agglomerans]